MSEGRRLRVLLACGAQPPMRCGVGDYTAGLARQLAASGKMDVAVLTARLAGRNGADVRGFDLLEPISQWDVSSLGTALAAIRSWKPDVVHIQYPAKGYDGPLPFLLGPAARFALGVPVVVTLHEPVDVKHQLLLQGVLTRTANAIVVVRPALRELIHEKGQWTLAGKELRLIPNSTTLPQVEPTPERIRAVRDRYRVGTKAMVAYFGLVYRARGVHQLFEIADPERHHLVIVGGTRDEDAEYSDAISRMARQGQWKEACTIAGYLPDEQAAEVLACADAVVMPFTLGGGSWNTSLHAARLQGTFVLTTSREATGYDSVQNVYYAQPGDIAEMRQALSRHIGVRRAPQGVPTWERIVADHLEIYERIRRR